MCLYLICVLGRPGAQLGISRGFGEVFSHSSIHLGEVEEAEERVSRGASSCGLGNKEIAWWACEHKFRSSLGVPTSVWIWAS